MASSIKASESAFRFSGLLSRMRAAGAVLVAINVRLTAAEIGYIVGHAGARVLVVDPSLAHLVADVDVERILVTGEHDSYEAFLASARSGEPEDRLESEDDTISI